jgi:hypothetical protein
VSNFLRSNTTPDVTVSFTPKVSTVLPLILEMAIFAPLPLSPLFLITKLSPTLYPSPGEKTAVSLIPEVLISETLNSCLNFSSTLSIGLYLELFEVI